MEKIVFNGLEVHNGVLLFKELENLHLALMVRMIHNK